jgi:hypothetical protein
MVTWKGDLMVVGLGGGGGSVANSWKTFLGSLAKKIRPLRKEIGA